MNMPRSIVFDWDQWNLQKNETKHGVSRKEAESVFFDEHRRLYADIKHSTVREKRFILYGQSMERRVLMVAFTLRGAKVRIITARTASRKERELYEGKEESKS